MPILNNLTLVNAKRVITQTPQEQRRAKLLAAVAEQQNMARALLADETYTVTREVWRKDEQGQRVRVARAKRLRPWFWRNTDGKWLLEVRYGARPLELGKGKRAVEVGVRAELPKVLGMIEDAVRAGELDSQIDAAVGARKLKLGKS